VTTLEIGSLAVAIALQDTLGNLFAGLYIKADRPLQVGHFVKLSTGRRLRGAHRLA
jgi:small-conductance mechanosensitive channel